MINSFEDIKKFINDKSFNKIFILCGKKSFVISGAKNLFKKFISDKEVKFFYKNSELPILEELIKIINEIKRFKPDLFWDFKQSNSITYPFKKKYTRLAVIPTTAGSGAEVTSNAVIYVNQIKYSFESELLIPDNFFLIPEFLISAPSKIKASAGFDAIAQAVESLVSKKSNEESLKYATKSLEISINCYNSFLNSPDLTKASEMIIASNLAGKAINISKTTAPHASSYPFTSLFNISHGHAVSLFFENFFKFNYDNLNKSETSFNLEKRFELIFKLFNVKNINDFCSKITSIKRKAQLEDNLKTLNININEYSEKIISGINLLRLGNNPVKINDKDIINIIYKNFWSLKKQ